MRSIYLAITAISLLTFSAFAQDTHRAEVFGGYQYTHLDGGVNANGWNAAVTGNLSNHFGVTADFSGAYDTVSGVSLNSYSYTFGPVVNFTASDKFKPFAHVLVGGFHASAGFGGFSASTNGFATMAGGGVDAGGGHLAWRVVQADWVLYHADGGTSKKNVRVCTGLILRF